MHTFVTLVSGWPGSVFVLLQEVLFDV